ncbi:MAG: arylamine N-acetyltransferase [Clostridia bacterium]|nr:arylamine N-acetyltransferase [Clostridia bacterium]
MYESLNAPIPNLDRYLRRLGMHASPGVNLNGLNELIWAHQTHIPFEDLNTSLLGLPVSLEIPSLYHKVVEQQRGGYCFELNALFVRLLKDLGFDARQVFCRVVRGRDFLPPCLHEGIVVALEGKQYFCDVGFGGPMPAGALRIEQGFGNTIRGEHYRIDRFDDYWWIISRITSDGRPEGILQFNTFPQQPQEFLAVNQKCARDSDSLFVKQVFVNLRTEDGVMSITGDEFTFRAEGMTLTEAIPDEAALHIILKERFGIAIINSGMADKIDGIPRNRPGC